MVLRFKLISFLSILLFSTFFVSNVFALECGGKVCTGASSTQKCESDRGKEICPIAAPGTNEEFEEIFGKVQAPAQLGKLNTEESGEAAINSVIQTIIRLIYAAAAVIFVFMLLFSGLQWIMSGGNKEAIAAAKNRLQWAIIGIVVLALAFVIIRILSDVTGFNLINTTLTGTT